MTNGLFENVSRDNVQPSPSADFDDPFEEDETRDAAVPEVQSDIPSLLELSAREVALAFIKQRPEETSRMLEAVPRGAGPPRDDDLVRVTWTSLTSKIGHVRWADLPPLMKWVLLGYWVHNKNERDAHRFSDGSLNVDLEIHEGCRLDEPREFMRGLRKLDPTGGDVAALGALLGLSRENAVKLSVSALRRRVAKAALAAFDGFPRSPLGRDVMRGVQRDPDQHLVARQLGRPTNKRQCLYDYASMPMFTRVPIMTILFAGSWVR